MILRVFFWGIVFTMLLRSPALVAAHGTGLPFVKINSVYTLENPLSEYAATSSFDIASDVASASGYIVRESIKFEIDNENFPNPYESIDGYIEPEFFWNFGDTTEKIEGNIVSHRYLATGTFVVTVEVKYPGKNEIAKEINSIQLDVMPSIGYQRPKAKIRIHYPSILDGRSIRFDGSQSRGEALSFAWDFSDETVGEGSVVAHKYKSAEYFPMFPILRVIDKNNVASYAHVLLESKKSNIFLDFWYTLIQLWK